MNILAIVQRASTKIGLARPSQVYGSSQQVAYDLQEVIADAVTSIVEAHDWQVLRAMATVTGDGASTEFDLPGDFNRMVKYAELWSSRYQWTMNHIATTDEWLGLLTLPYTQVSGSWTIYGGKLHILDTMASTETAKFFYIRDKAVTSEGGTHKAAFTADTDSFRLNDDLLRLAIIYKWKQAKEQDYSEEMADFNIMLNRMIDKDGGSKPILSGNRPVRAKVAWPGTISGVAP